MNSLNFLVFSTYQKGWDFQYALRLVSDIYFTGVSNILYLHHHFFTYLLLPLYVFIDRSGVLFLYVNSVIFSIIGIYYFLLSDKLLNSKAVALMLTILFFFHYYFFDYQLRDFGFDYYLFIIPAFYYVILQKYKTAFLFTLLNMLSREDGYFIALMPIVYLILTKNYKVAFYFFCAVCFIAISLTIVSKKFIGYIPLNYDQTSEKIVFHEDISFLDKPKIVNQVYSQLGADFNAILKNAVQSPLIFYKRLVSEANKIFLITIFSTLLFVPFLNLKVLFFYFFIPFIYAFFSDDNASLRDSTHLCTYTSGIYITLLLTLKSIQTKYSKKNIADIFLMIIVIAIIAQQIKPLKNRISGVAQLPIKHINHKIFFDDLSRKNAVLQNYLSEICKNIQYDEVIITTERLLYFMKNTNNAVSFWQNEFIFNDSAAYLNIRNTRKKIFAFVLDYSFDNQKGDGLTLVENINILVDKTAYRVIYNEYPYYIAICK
ncbi:MAG TPA: DUF2079 domain-containing protein [bacterium]|nr:DUF2079 domain-containing protein [bacterium]